MPKKNVNLVRVVILRATNTGILSVSSQTKLWQLHKAVVPWINVPQASFPFSLSSHRQCRE